MELMEKTEWEKYGVGCNPKCSQCMLHSGFEPSAVNDMIKHPLKALWVFLRGPRTAGPMAADFPTVSCAAAPEEREDKEIEHSAGI
jgi:hypothetical protein